MLPPTVVVVGSKNRERRAAKQKARDRRRGQDGEPKVGLDDRDTAAWAFGGPRWSPEIVSDVVLGLIYDDDPDTADEWREALAAPPAADVDIVERGLELALIHRFKVFWANGWLPLDLVEHLRRLVPAALHELAREAMAVQMSRYARASMHPRWWESVVAAEVRPDRRPEGPSTRAWARRNLVMPPDLLEAVLTILRALAKAWILHPIVPPPGSAAARRAAQETEATAGIDPKVLARVRALLAKAESTSFPDEAEALSGKAQELMNRYALERAVVEGVDAQRGAVMTVRLWLDPPYVQAKTLLVQAVARANRCQSVALTGTDMVSIVGHESDVDTVQILVTTLLVQAGRAMAAEGRATAGGGRSRSRTFRQSFLVAYAGRIGERLSEAAEGTADDVSDDRLLPVLAARASAVDDAVGELFGDLSSKIVTGHDRAGQAAGRAAADSASLDLERDRLSERR